MPTARLTPNEVMELQMMRAYGKSNTEMARRFGLHIRPSDTAPDAKSELGRMLKSLRARGWAKDDRWERRDD
jgi:hypothetical protein